MSAKVDDKKKPNQLELYELKMNRRFNRMQIKIIQKKNALQMA